MLGLERPFDRNADIIRLLLAQLRELHAQLVEMQCRDLCLMIPGCLAVDYNSAETSCWQHTTATYCNA